MFAGTRVPVQILWDHLESGIRPDEFLDDHPTLSREQAVSELESALEILLDNTRESIA